jgi:hypothetical protein
VLIGVTATGLHHLAVARSADRYKRPAPW